MYRRWAVTLKTVCAGEANAGRAGCAVTPVTGQARLLCAARARAGVGWPTAEALNMGSLRDNLEGMQAAAAHQAQQAPRDSDGEELDDSIMILGTTPQARRLCCAALILF